MPPWVLYRIRVVWSPGRARTRSDRAPGVSPGAQPQPQGPPAVGRLARAQRGGEISMTCLGRTGQRGSAHPQTLGSLHVDPFLLEGSTHSLLGPALTVKWPTNTSSHHDREPHHTLDAHAGAYRGEGSGGVTYSSEDGAKSVDSLAHADDGLRRGASPHVACPGPTLLAHGAGNDRTHAGRARP